MPRIKARESWPRPPPTTGVQGKALPRSARAHRSCLTMRRYAERHASPPSYATPRHTRPSGSGRGDSEPFIPGHPGSDRESASFGSDGPLSAGSSRNDPGMEGLGVGGGGRGRLGPLQKHAADPGADHRAQRRTAVSEPPLLRAHAVSSRVVLPPGGVTREVAVAAGRLETSWPNVLSSAPSARARSAAETPSSPERSRARQGVLSGRAGRPCPSCIERGRAGRSVAQPPPPTALRGPHLMAPRKSV